jgi:hypothetical protein
LSAAQNIFAFCFFGIKMKRKTINERKTKPVEKKKKKKKRRMRHPKNKKQSQRICKNEQSQKIN